MSITSVIHDNVSGVYIVSFDGIQSCAPPLKNRKGELIQIPEILLKLYVHERSHDDVLAHLGMFAFTGSRSGADLTLTATEMPLKENETRPEGESKTAEMKLTFSDGQWLGTFSLMDGGTVNVSLEKQQDLPSEAVENLAHVSKLDLSSTICSIVNTLVNYILDFLEVEVFDMLRPMAICGVQTSGRGAYIFGQDAPGINFPPIGLSTIYVPCDTVLCGKTSKPYKFYLTLGDFWGNPETILDILNDIVSFLNPFDLDINEFFENIKSWLKKAKKAKFAVVFQLSTFTGGKGLYFLNDMGVTTNDLNYSDEYKWFRILKKALDILTRGELYLYAGNHCSDTWDACNGPVPIWPTCTSPFWFMYVFGTAQVHFD
jgi:hypothetical protein